MADDWGPLGPLAGGWQGEGGLDTAYSHAEHKVLDTPYLEKLTFKPFGPVANGHQLLYGLDYKSAMWRGNQENPFHTEVGYWLWDAAAGEVMRCFMVPRGSVLIAGGNAKASDTSTTTRSRSREPSRTPTSTGCGASAKRAAQSRVIGVVSSPRSSTVVLPARSASKNPASFASRA